MKTHKVTFGVDNHGHFDYDVPTLVVDRGDKIVWKCRKPHPFGIIIKALPSPLDLDDCPAPAGRKITAVVRRDAVSGYYQYAVTVHDGKRLRLDDPEIIIRPPEGRGK